MTSYENVIFLDRYKVTEKLHETSVFLSFLGTDLVSGNSVLIKLLNPARCTRYEVDRICFTNEVTEIKKLDHPNILTLIDAAPYGKSMCIVYTFCEYHDLDQYLSGHGTLSVDAALSITAQIASALRYAHERNILHRNIKSTNIGISDSSGEPRAKLFDFGMSYIIDYMNSSSTQVDNDFGYMAPESTGLLDRKVDQRSDLYSLGIVLYRMLTGALPFHADSIDNMVYQHVAVAPSSPSSFNKDIPEEVSKMILKLLAKDPDLRYQTANELINDIDRYSCKSVVVTRMLDRNLLQSIEQKTRLLGRKSELSQLRTMCREALETKGHFCTVHGRLGFGKSDLFTNLTSELINGATPFFRAHFTAQSNMTPYSGFCDVLNDYINLFDRYDRKLKVTERNRLARVLNGLSDTVTSICPNMAKVLPSALSLPALESYKEQQRTLNLLSAFILSLYTQEKPFVLILDDIHYADAASLSLLTEMAAMISDYNVFVVCSYRDDPESEENLYLRAFLDSLEHNPDYHDDITLEPYSEQRMCDFLSDILGTSKDECQGLSSYLLGKTEGNPYFTSNVLRSMLEDGVISVNNGMLSQDWDKVKQLDSDNIIGDLVTTRIERLSKEAVSFFEIAAVIGSDFPISLMLSITGRTKDEVSPWISAAIEQHLLDFSSGRDTMCFAHADVHSSFLSRIPDDHKRDIHRSIAHAMETEGSDIHRYLYQIIYHFTEAGDEEGVYKYIVPAADASRASNANDDSLLYYRRALPLVEAHEGRESNTWFKVKRAIIELSLTTGHFDDAIAVARDLLPLIKDKLVMAGLLRCIGLGYFRQGRFEECEGSYIEALLQLGERFPKSSRELNFRYRLYHFNRDIAVSLNKGCNPERHPADIERIHLIVSLYESLCWIYFYTDLRKFEYTALYLFAYTNRYLGSSVELATAASTLSVYYMLHGRQRLCAELQALSLSIRKSLADQFGIARGLLFTALGDQWQGDLDKSVKLFVETAALFEKIGDRWEINNTYNYLAISLLISGEYKECSKICNNVIKHSMHIGDNMSLCQAYTTLISCYTELGDYEHATQIAYQCMPVVTALSIPYTTTTFYTAYGKLLLEQGKFREAAGYLDQACELLDHNNIVSEMTVSAYTFRTIAKIRLLDAERSKLSIAKITQYENTLRKLCASALDQVQGRPNLTIPAYRAAALLGIITGKYRITEECYDVAVEKASATQTRFENAKLYYEYGIYLHNKHRISEARFFIFEAYMTFSGISSEYYLKLCENIISEKYQDDFNDDSILANVTARRNRMNIDRKINTLLKLGERLTSTLEIEDLQRKILQDAVELVGAERGILFLYPESGPHHLYVASVYNLGKFDCNTYDWMLEEVERTKKPVVINDVQSDEYRRHYTVLVRYGIKSVMAMPMFVRGNLFGVIYLDSRLVRHIFSEDYIETMGFIANQAGAPISNARLYHRAITDGLTGIYGRSYLDNLIVDRTSDPEAKLAAIMIDVDHFKACNDTYGHPFGDRVLVQIAGIMKRISGDHGVPCRYGGEEFVILFDSNDPEYILDISEKIRLAVENTSIAINDGTGVKMVSVTISLGLSIWSPSFERIDLIEHADKALYYAKTHGRNRSVLWSPDMEGDVTILV